MECGKHTSNSTPFYIESELLALEKIEEEKINQIKEKYSK